MRLTSSSSSVILNHLRPSSEDARQQLSVRRRPCARLCAVEPRKTPRGAPACSLLLLTAHAKLAPHQQPRDSTLVRQNDKISCSFFLSSSSTFAMNRSVVFWI